VKVTFIVGGQFVLTLNLAVDPDPNNIAASLAQRVNNAFQNRAELAHAGAVYAVTWAGDNFGSQDDLEMGDVELGDTSSIVIWANALPRKRVARKIRQVVEVATFDEILRKRGRGDEDVGEEKRRRLTDDGECVM
jgi:hypothetical protein